MRGAYLEPRKTVERSLEDQVRQRDRGLEWIADRIGQEAAAGEPTARLQFAGAKWVHEHQHAQFLALRPERVEFWVRQFLAGNAAGNADAAKPEFLDRVLDLLRSEVRKLQRRRREADETIGYCTLISCSAASRSARHQNGLMLSASTSTPDLSMCVRRSPTFDQSSAGASSG